MNLPKCFNKGLKFGDLAQIDYVKSLRAEYEEEEHMKKQGMKKYRVHVYVEGEYEKEVYAINESDAEGKVEDEFDIDCVDFDFTFEAVEKETE